MVRKKHKTKRQPLKEKYKIQKKVKEHRRKLKKQTKKNPYLRKRLVKDPGIPNLWPMKDALLNKIAADKREEIEEKKKRAEERKRAKTTEQQIVEMQQKVTKRTDQFEERVSLVKDAFNLKDSSKKTFFREFKKVVKAADVILEVLDARDPLGSRSTTIEKQILSMDPNKRIILVLNKIDLVPSENSEAWLNLLRDHYPTIAFKSSTQKQKTNLGQKKRRKQNNNSAGTACLGADTLIELLKNYSRSSTLKKSISVGIIGFPNVGKSSLINSLKRSKATAVSSKAGYTRTSQEIVLDKNITLIDCPGIIFSSDMSESDAALRNCINFEQLENCTLPIKAILEKCPREKLLQIYKIPAFYDVQEFLRLVAQKRGKILRGGIPNIEEAARTVIKDWTTGFIPFFTIPPDTQNTSRISGPTIVSEWSAEFKLDEIVEMEKSVVLNKIPHRNNLLFATGLEAKELTPDEMFMNITADDEDSNDDLTEKFSMAVDGENKLGKIAIAEIKDKKAVQIKLATTEKTINKLLKKEFQREQKQIKKETKEMKENQMENNVPVNEDYDFGADFWTSDQNLPNPVSAMEDVDSEIKDVDAFSF